MALGMMALWQLAIGNWPTANDNGQLFNGPNGNWPKAVGPTLHETNDIWPKCYWPNLT